MKTGKFRVKLLLLIASACAGAPLDAQTQRSIEPVRPEAPWGLRTYRGVTVPPIHLGGSELLKSLIRAGNLYLTVQDAIALTLENNLDLESARYNPILDEWAIERAEAGGPIRGVPNASTQVGSVASGQGISGSQTAAGITSNPNDKTNNSSGNVTIQQIGPITAVLDPSLIGSTFFSHLTTPQVNEVQSRVNALVDSDRLYTTSIQKGFLTGTVATLSYTDSYQKENTPTDILNPTSAPRFKFSFQQQLLQGLATGISGVNGRFIRAAKLASANSRESFKAQAIDTVTNVLILYWELSIAQSDLSVKQGNLDIARQFYNDTNRQIQIGTVAPNQLLRAEGDVASRELEVSEAQHAVQTRIIALKDAISRHGAGDPLLADVGVITMNRPEIPAHDDLPPLSEMIRSAVTSRPDVTLSNVAIKAAEIAAEGTKNGLLPTAVAFGNISQTGLAGTPNPASGEIADPYFSGGFGKALGQTLRRDFPGYQAGAYMILDVKNLSALPDYDIDQLQLRQTQLTAQRTINQATADISNQALALSLARSRYEAARKAVALQQQLLEGILRRWQIGTNAGSTTPATLFDVVQARRDLAAAQSNELAAAATWVENRIRLDQALGITLEANHIQIEDALQGAGKR